MKVGYALLGAVILFGSSLLASDVNSPNIVGFYQISTPPGQFVLIAIQFKDIDSKDKINLQDIFRSDELNAGQMGDVENSDQVFIPKGTNYVSFYFAKNAEDAKPAWLDDKGKPAKKTISMGESFWFKRTAKSKKTQLTLSGEVPAQRVEVKNALPGLTVVQ